MPTRSQKNVQYTSPATLTQTATTVDQSEVHTHTLSDDDLNAIG